MNKGILVAFAFLFGSLMASNVVMASAGFQGGNVVTLNYTNTTTACSPSMASIYQGYQEAQNASATTSCEIGVGTTIPVNSFPTFLLVPSFAGLSIFGFTSWNSTASGYPTFNGITIVTDCGAAGTASSCPETPNSIKNYYSPTISSWEKTLGITKGIYGLPQGVMPNSARDLLVPGSAKAGPTYLVRVAVYDPNIFPNATTGKCTQWVASNLTNATGNCLTTRSALARALVTSDSAVALANKNNILYTSKGLSAPVQASITLVNITYQRTGVGGAAAYTTNVTTYTTTNVNASNVNAVRYLASVTPKNSTSTSTPVTTPMSNTTTIQPTVTPPPTTTPASTSNQTAPSGSASGSSSTLIVAIIVVVIIIVVLGYFMMRKK